MFTKTLAAVTLAASLVACVQQETSAPSSLQTALPTADQVQIKLPAASARAVGELADWYVATRDVTRMFNGGSAWVLVLIHTIVKFPVTTVNGDTYTWGPWSDTLDPAEYKLDVRELADGTYEYQLSGRSKITAGSQFEIVIDGKADPRPGELKGNGQFLLDFDASRRVNPVDAGDERGTITAHYDLAAHHLDLEIDSVDDRGQPVTADYAYNETAGGGGDMTFNINGNAGKTDLNEQITLRSRWQNNGSGRADARLAGGDLGTVTAIASECWDTSFKRVYYTDSVNFAPTEGVASACAFATADLPPQK
ncbi:MAG TPA: hypothetical protein VNO30_31295 [Kofleriaceae bacterium]|nr:hypothetical protein [Kofleriaceae bacterium]